MGNNAIVLGKNSTSATVVGVFMGYLETNV